MSDPDDDTLLFSRVQWYRAANADAEFIDKPIDPTHMANPSYTPTAADQCKYLKVRVFYVERSCGEVSSFDDRCRSEAEFTFDTLVANEEGLIVQSQVVNNPATGAPGISGTARVGWTFTADRDNLRDEDGMTSPVRLHWIRLDPVTATDENVQNPESPGWGWTYVVQGDDVGKAIKVRASFTDDAGHEESLTSSAVTVTTLPLTATSRDAPEFHDGATPFTFELRFSEAPAIGFAMVQNHAFTVTGGSVSSVRRLELDRNLRWEITVTPASDADVTLTLNATTDCSAEGAICNADGVKLSGGLELVVPGALNYQAPPENSAATGAPTINGRARVGETLTAITTGISDADGVANASYTYQWLADDVDISGAKGSSYTVATADEGKAIKVTVSFTDDAGTAETLISAATTAVTQPPLTATTHDVPLFHDGATAFTFELRISEAPGGRVQRHDPSGPSPDGVGRYDCQRAPAGNGQEPQVGDNGAALRKRGCHRGAPAHHRLRRRGRHLHRRWQETIRRAGDLSAGPTELGGHRRTYHRRHGAGGRDAHGEHHGHLRCRRQCRDSDQRRYDGSGQASFDGHGLREALFSRREQLVHLRAAVQREHGELQLHDVARVRFDGNRGLGEQGAEAGGWQERPVGDHSPAVLKRRCDHRVAHHHGLLRTGSHLHK